MKTDYSGDPRRPRWQAMEEAGMTRAEIARQNNVSRELVRKVLGNKVTRRQVGPTQRPSQHFYCHHKQYKAVADIAHSKGYYLASGENAGKGSVGLLIEAIGDGAEVVLNRQRYDELLATEGA